MKPSDYVRKGWCQGAEARTAYGSAVNAENSLAVSWCLMGAMLAACAGRTSLRRRRYAAILDRLNGPLEWNDAPERTQAEVVALLESLEE